MSDDFSDDPGAHTSHRNPETIIIPATQENKDALSQAAFGMTKDEALTKGICVQCKKPHALERCYSDAGRREYQITGLCEPCYDSMFADEEVE